MYSASGKLCERFKKEIYSVSIEKDVKPEKIRLTKNKDSIRYIKNTSEKVRSAAIQKVYKNSPFSFESSFESSSSGIESSFGPICITLCFFFLLVVFSGI